MAFTLVAAILVFLVEVYFLLCIWSFALFLKPNPDIYAYPKRTGSQSGTPKGTPSRLNVEVVVNQNDAASITSSQIQQQGQIISFLHSTSVPHSIGLKSPNHSISPKSENHSQDVSSYPVEHVVADERNASRAFFASLPRQQGTPKTSVSVLSESAPTSFLANIDDSDLSASHSRSVSNPLSLQHKLSYPTLQHNQVPASYPPPKDIGPEVPKVYY
ncbi:hypothetical protein HDU97_006858 [Phlyctochytrium planicorne]|nr:hypothetical protein HDU97_006858 [Phlyctochytrium planicorne]